MPVDGRLFTSLYFIPKGEDPNMPGTRPGTMASWIIFAALHRLRIPPNARVPEGIPSKAHIVTGGSPRVAFRTHATQGSVIKMLYYRVIGGNTG